MKRAGGEEEEEKLKNKYFLLKMTACESSGYTGASFSIPAVTLYSVYLRSCLDVSNLINNMLSKWFPLPVHRCWGFFAGVFFGGFDQTQKKAPLSVLFLSVICISPHIGKLLRASKSSFLTASWVSLNYIAISRWYWGKILRYFPVWRRYSPLSSLSAFCIPFESVW